MHDLLLTKRGISAPANHPLRLTVEKHRARLAAELTRARLKRGFATLEQLRAHVKEGGGQSQAERRQSENRTAYKGDAASQSWPQPRWVRINTLKTTMERQLNTTFAGYKLAETLDEVLSKYGLGIEPKLIYIDKYIPNLLALPPATDLSKKRAYFDGLIILQDKASCFPAYLLDPDPQDCCLDGCAAPGNKTTHLAAILHEKGQGSSVPERSIHASERDSKRASTLGIMVRKAGASDRVHVHRQDFLKFEPTNLPCSSVGALLLDPSCSGSGIISRDEAFNVKLPRVQADLPSKARPKRKRRRTEREPSEENSVAGTQEEAPVPTNETAELLQVRLSALSEFQMRLLLHALHFPKAHKITYSTCSIYAEENENVVIKALLQSGTENLGWRILRRDEQVQGMRAWNVRGYLETCQKLLSGPDLDAKEIAEACIRCEKGTAEGTQGFFVAAFVRDIDSNVLPADEQEEEWEGFDDT